MDHEGPKNWGLVIFVLGSTFVLYLFLIFQHANTASVNQDLNNKVDALSIENEELHKEILRLNIKLAKIRDSG